MDCDCGVDDCVVSGEISIETGMRGCSNNCNDDFGGRMIVRSTPEALSV
jgi:hypothetical protein